MILDDAHDPVSVPTAQHARWVERLLWAFLLSFSLDYRADFARAGGAGTGIDQLLFVAGCLASTAAIFFLGWRYLFVRPGSWLLVFWGGFLAYMLVNAFLQGVPAGRSLRIILPLCLCFAGMMNAHIAGCMGIRPSRIVAPVLVAACINVVWRITQGFLFKDITLDTARVEIQSSANNWIAAFIGCSLLLRRRLHWTLFLAAGVMFGGILVTVTRSLLFPIMASAVATFGCYFLGAKWGIYRMSELPRRIAPAAAVTGLALLAIGIAALAHPRLLERWEERLFHHAADRNLPTDISWLTREAEASSIFKILNEDPIHYAYGHGIGASYYWDPTYYQEVSLVYPKEELIAQTEVWFAGHSVWTYSLFSGGIPALLAHIGIIVAVMFASVRAARANATDPGPDQWLSFLPCVAAFCLLSETLTSNPFDERLAGLIFGVMAGLSQSFFVRASWIHSRDLHA
ncbi:hypothetical protein HAHE_27860 [Haloferula helveola]|uniref:O-antigen ligase n=1 Tax=Haloferula helveola TaxID=490095 RepID=A0ABM7RE50_9BACT|nr:hypothetical protein HAHE_27860 [Haloferula helveola]